jgi:3-dehydroquinate dehydratase / shikimate dehydrogenase
MAEICVCSHHTSIASLLEDVEFRSMANRDGFLVELRLDAYKDLSASNLDRALDVFGPQVIVTYRHHLEGGHNPNASDSERIGFLQHAASRKVKYVDLEARCLTPKFQKGNSKLILSYHSFGGVPDYGHLLRQWRSMSQTPADIIKIACFPKMIDDGIPLLKLMIAAREANSSVIVLGMGEAGFWTRVVGPLFGAAFTFSRGEGAPGTAPGQPTWRELEEVYRYRQIKPGWPVYGVIGNPIGHSLSPLMHNAALRELNMDGVYVPFKVEGDPVEFTDEFARLGIRGLSVTIPHKETVEVFCAEVEPVAKSIGAVNTLILRPDGKWNGTNTDAMAAADSLEDAAGSLRGKNVVILGAGGAAKAVAFGVKERGAEVFLLNRSAERAEALAKAVGGKAITQAGLAGLKIDVIVNTTPVGMHPEVNASPLKKEEIPQGSIVFDTVYNPLRTQLLKLAEERGCKTLEGLDMFVGQGARQFEIWTGKKAPRAVMREVVLKALNARQAAQK